MRPDRWIQAAADEAAAIGDPLYSSWAETAVTRSLEPEFLIRRAEDEGIGAGHEEDFLGLELLLGAVLGVAVLKAFRKHEDVFWEILDKNVKNLPQAIDAITAGMGTAVSPAVESRIRQVSDASMRRGAAVAGVTDLAETIGAQSVRRGIVSSTKYYTNAFFNERVVPGIFRAVDDALETGSVAKYRAVRESLDTRLKSVPYWRVVANASSSRGYHYGVLKGAQLNGFTGYRILTIPDDRRSDICEHMDGKEFWVADGVQKLERVASAETPDEVKDLTPWRSLAEIQEIGDDPTLLNEAGVGFPPFHANCRSTVELIR